MTCIYVIILYRLSQIMFKLGPKFFQRLTVNMLVSIISFHYLLIISYHTSFKLKTPLKFILRKSFRQKTLIIDIQH